ncbi:hypothetical protein GQ600_16821 [Phytophthora cactorum]|nr:hypothetical protein GQ600_16821 [Phytophthora cactorum]
MNKDNNPLDLTLWDIQVSGHVAILVVSSLHVWEGDQLKPMTAEVLQTIRDQSALLFRCLYISGRVVHGNAPGAPLAVATLGDVYASTTLENDRYRYVKTEAKDKEVAHFARCLVDALKEFAETDKRLPVDDAGNSLDPTTWGIQPFGAMGYTGYYYSLLEGYVLLNLLLLDADKFLPILQRGRKDSVPYYIELLCGYCDGGHPDWWRGVCSRSWKDTSSSR